MLDCRGQVRRVRVGSLCRIAAPLLLLACLPGLALLAQGTKAAAPGAEKVKGTISAVEKKGRQAKLVIDADASDEPLEILLNPKIDFSVVGPGDQTFFQPKLMVSTDSAFTVNNLWFARNLTVYLDGRPAVGVAEDRERPGTYRMCGQIMEATQESLTVNFGNAGTRKVMLEHDVGIKVQVVTSNPDLAAEGLSVEVEGTKRGSKFLPTKIVVTSDKAFKSDELLQDKRPRTKTASKKADSKKDDAADEDPLKKTNDPFSVLKKADTKGAKPEAKPDGNKPEAGGEKTPKN